MGDLEAIVQTLLEELGMDTLDNPHLVETPRRVAHSLRELTTPVHFEFTTFENKDINQMVTITGVPFYTLCAHHLLPFFGHVHFGYIPSGRLAGLSKFARTVDYFMRSLNIQEEMTQDMLDFIVEHLDPIGAMVVVEGTHLCMAMRGAESVSRTTTSAVYGVFLDPEKRARDEFLALIGRDNGR